MGRAAELAVLAELVRTLRRGGRLAVVEGEAGIGRTRLVEATVAAAERGDRLAFRHELVRDAQWRRNCESGH